jgi:predicted nucleic acid-binding protein
MPRKKAPVGLPVAVIDNTLLSRLAELNLAEKLPLIFKKIRIPPEVRREAYRGSNRRRLKNLLNENKGFFVDCYEADPGIKEILKTIIDEGEAAAIAQAEATGSSVITDDKKGYEQARKREIEVFRTGAVLCMLKEAGQIPSVATFLAILIKKGFHLDPIALEDISTKASEPESLQLLIELQRK